MAFTLQYDNWLVQSFQPPYMESTKILFNDYVEKAGLCTLYSRQENGNQAIQTFVAMQYVKGYEPPTNKLKDFITSFSMKWLASDNFSEYPYFINNYNANIDSTRHIAFAPIWVKLLGSTASCMFTLQNNTRYLSILPKAGIVNLNPQDYIYGGQFPINEVAPFIYNFVAKLGLPKYEDDYSEPQGGGGSYSDTSENVLLDSLDTINNKSILRTSFISQYWLSQTQLTALSNEFWSDNMITQIKKMFAEPMDAIVSLSLLPVVPDVTESVAVIVGRYRTNINAPIVFKQFVEIDCGELDLKEFWGTALDYSPNTTLEIFLPYIGTRTINIDDVQASTIKLKYRIDTVTGQCVAFLSRVKDDVDNILYTWDGNCAYNISLSAQNFTSAYQSMLQSAGALGVGLVTDNAGLGMVTGAISSLTASAKPTISRGGSMNGTNGILGYKTPYLIVTRPIQSYPADFETFKGYPSNITAKLGDLSGFTKVNTIHLENITATEKELEEIERLLKAGVIL